MKQEIIDRLSLLTEEEQFILVRENDDSHHSLYSKSKRFVIERRHMSNIILGESTAPISMSVHPRFRDFPVHSHDYIEIMYVCSGSITHVFKDRELRLDTDSIILLGKETQHSIRAAGKGDIGINLIVSVELFESLLNRIRQNSTLPLRQLEALIERGDNSFCVFSVSQNISVRNLIENMIYSVFYQTDSDGYTLQQSLELLLCYLASMQRTQNSLSEDSYEEKNKKKILNYIRTSYSTATLTEAAQMLGLSAPYLSRWVKRQLGSSFKELLMTQRFSTAEKMLLRTDIPIGDIINNVGYENSSYFHKEFKRRYGMPPSEYRSLKKE
jgi:AraC-like DNA-binding protein/mannose-6-phosphate isomerase-like protein (cupin superfamily)